LICEDGIRRQLQRFPMARAHLASTVFWAMDGNGREQSLLRFPVFNLFRFIPAIRLISLTAGTMP
jgi:hypothetical protein